MIRTTGIVITAACLAALCPAASPAWAGELAPGETGSDYEDDGIFPFPDSWGGELVAEREEPFRIQFADEDGSRFVEGVFTSRVFRRDGGFDFLYSLEETAQAGIYDLEFVDISGFGAAPVDVYTTSNEFVVRRSADGDMLSFQFDQSSMDSFLVRSAAPGYFLNPGGFDIAVDFPPSSSDRGAAFAAYAPVPEPSAAAGLGAAMLLLRRTRRRGAGR